MQRSWNLRKSSELKTEYNKIQLWLCKLLRQFLCGGTFKHCNEATPGAAQCLPDPSPLCAAEPSDFICTGEGVFPDPSDCKSYFFCTKDPTGSLIAENLFCDDLYVFDPSGPKNNFCRLTVNRYCTTANCAGAFKNILLSYAFFPKSMGQLVASCQGDSPAIVTRCEAGFEANLSSLPVECNLVCTGAKKEAHPTDETKYYECVYVGSRWESKVKSCFSTYYFNATKKQCEVKPTTTPAPATVAPASAWAATTFSGIVIRRKLL